MSRYLGLYNFFYSYEGISKYSTNQKMEIINKINSCRSLQDIRIISKGLNHCSNIFDMKDNKYYKAIYKKIKKIFLTIRIDENYLFFNNIPTTFLTKFINDLVAELHFGDNDKNSLSILMDNIMYMINLIYERDEFKIVIIDDLVKNTNHLYNLLVVINYMENENRQELTNKIYKDVFKYSDYKEMYIQSNKLLSKMIEN